MLQKIDKLAPYAALALLGYLTYSSLETHLPRAAQGRETPTISPKLLDPPPTVVADRASPAGRDPFEVSWASYLNKPARSRPTPKTAPASRPAPVPTDHPPPPLPGNLVGIFASDGPTLAVIGDQIHKTGSVTGNGDPESNWTVESITQDSVTLRFGDQTTVLRMRSDSPEKPARQGGRR